MRGEVFKDYRVLSHRWEDPAHPDPDGTKIKELQAFLRAEPSVKGVWIYYPCLPQDEKDKDGNVVKGKTAEEKRYFDYSLDMMNLVYMGGRVVVTGKVELRNR